MLLCLLVDVNFFGGVHAKSLWLRGLLVTKSILRAELTVKLETESA